MQKKTTVENIVHLVRQKTEEGFSLLYEYYSASLYGCINHLIKDKTIAEDILQDTFIKIWKNISSFDESKGTFFTWMLNIARNTALDYMRRQKNYLKHNQEATLPEHGFTEYSDIQNLLEELEPSHYEVLRLIYFEGYTHEQASKLLAIPLGTVKSRIRSALKRLKHIFCAYET